MPCVDYSRKDGYVLYGKHPLIHLQKKTTFKLLEFLGFTADCFKIQLEEQVDQTLKQTKVC